mmetsp:Transcript_9611/g.22560  ORF Transcript_9611/g.22560 Transcript_9611/m.22560 type:complete len:100 (-) Transcript_9611:840-1139(-)
MAGQVEFPTKDKKLLLEDERYATRFTSSKRGYCKLSWTSSEGIQMYNKWMEKVDRLRGEKKKTGKILEAYLRAKFEEEKPRKKKKAVKGGDRAYSPNAE